MKVEYCRGVEEAAVANFCYLEVVVILNENKARSI